MTIMCGPGEPSEHDLAEVAKFKAFLESKGERAERTKALIGEGTVHVPGDSTALVQEMSEYQPPAKPPRCPECVQGKHPNCDGYTWDDELDEPTACPCDVAGHPN
jgi:hypothetical protein